MTPSPRTSRRQSGSGKKGPAKARADREGRYTENGQTRFLKDLASLKALADPIRVQMLFLMEESPRTVKEMAKELELPATRLYYHVRILMRAGLIRVARLRMVSGIEERSYKTTASTWSPSPAVTHMLGKAGVLRAMFDMAATELDLALNFQPDTEIGDPNGAVPLLSLTKLTVPRESIQEFQRRIHELISEFTPTETRVLAGSMYHALFALCLSPGEISARRKGASDAS